MQKKLKSRRFFTNPRPMGWKLAFSVWTYALVLFVITDIVKDRRYVLLDHGGLRFRR